LSNLAREQFVYCRMIAVDRKRGECAGDKRKER
jgi:hypothetical protein